MYSRSYFTEEEKIKLPENYDGTAFSGDQPDEAEEAAEEVAVSDDDGACATSGDRILSRSDGLPLFGNLFGNIKLPFLSSLKLPKIGTEEILILAAAFFLFLSKDGDRECAIMLLLLLLVN